MNRLALILAVLLAGCDLAVAQDTNFAYRVSCEVQTKDAELQDLVWLQGTTPLIAAAPMKSGRPLSTDSNVTVRMLIAPSETNAVWAVASNTVNGANSYYLQWPTIGTNTAGEAWWYTIYFERDGQRYWTGSGDLYIDATTSTEPDGLEWIEYTTPSVDFADVVGDPADNAALVTYVAEHVGGSAEDTVARAGVASNAAAIAIMQTGKLDVATAATTYQPIGDYATGTPLYVETYLGTVTGATITSGTVTTNGGVLEFVVEGGGSTTPTNSSALVSMGDIPENWTLTPTAGAGQYWVQTNAVTNIPLPFVVTSTNEVAYFETVFLADTNHAIAWPTNAAYITWAGGSAPEQVHNQYNTIMWRCHRGHASATFLGAYP